MTFRATSFRWKRHCSSCSWMVGRSCSQRLFKYHSLFMAVWQIVSQPIPLAEKQPHKRRQGVLLRTSVLPDAPNNWRGHSSEKMTFPQSSAVPVEYQSVSNVFPGASSLLFFLYPLSPHCALQMLSHLLRPFLSKVCTCGTLIPQLNQLWSP